MTRTPKPVRYDVGGETVEIPVDRDGYVPTTALAARFQQVGDPADLRRRSETVLPERCTPSQVLRWWMDPSSCDVEGLDTKDSRVYDVSSVKDKSVQRRIAVVDATPDEQARIRRVLSESFSKEELAEMTRNGSFVIKAVPGMGDSTGCYLRRQDGIDVPLIMLEEGSSRDNIVHEAVHHLRAVDRTRQDSMRTTLPSDDEGRLKRVFSRIPRKWGDALVSDEEKLTVAETMVRTGLDEHSGYYDMIPGKDPHEAYVEDLYTLTGTDRSVPPEEIPRLTGVAARNAVLHGYAYTNIARAQILDRDRRRRRRTQSRPGAKPEFRLNLWQAQQRIWRSRPMRRSRRPRKPEKRREGRTRRGAS